MIPRFADTLAWQQAELLMQPAFIRLVDNLRKQLDASAWKGTYEEVQDPHPQYYLCLQHRDQSVTLDLWQLCYQICFCDYIPGASTEKQLVQIDTTLIHKTGDIDWEHLDAKTQQILHQIFANLPIV